MVTFGLAIDGSWAQIYLDRVQTSLQQATVAASTNSDHDALQLLGTQLANLAKWESVVVAERQNHNGARTVAPNSLQNDPVLTKFSNCAKFLTTLLGSGMFAENPSCTTCFALPPEPANAPLFPSFHLIKTRNQAEGHGRRPYSRRRFLPRVRGFAAA